MAEPGDLVWFDPGIGYMLPGEVVEFSRPAQVITVQAIINNKPQTFTIHNLQNVQKRQDLGESGVEDMIHFMDLNEASLLWNLKIRFENENIYTYTGSILVSVNPYRMFDIYGLENVKKYEGQILGTLPPHLFAIGSAAYGRMSKDAENQVVIISGESGAGKTESTKLIMQYLAAVNKSPSNLITEQILEASPLLESFGNAKTVRNDNSSRFGKYLEVHFKDGVITGAKTTEYLLEKSRIVTQATDERNYHVFYEMLDGLSDDEKEKYGLQSADKYFYLSQGGNHEIPGKNDEENFRSLLAAMQVLGFTLEEQDTIFRILASVLHFGNIYFNRKKLKHGQEGVELGSDGEVRWTSHLLKIPVEGILRALTTRTTETRNERMVTPLNIDQALDVRDAVAKSLYSNLFTWLVQRVNKIVCKGSKKTSIAILDIFGFEDFRENSFEQLCINYANENLQYHFNKHIFKLEQHDYAKEKIEWQTISYEDNQPVLHLIGKKPVGIFPLLDDESNFPKASDMSFLEKCHYNHALNELYSRPRMSSMEFGIRHYAGQVWYSVDGFLDKNKDTLRYDVMDLLISSQLPMISAMFQEVRSTAEAAKTMNRSDGRFITMKPRAPTVAARFQDSLQNLLDKMSKCHPWFVRCIKPNNEKQPMKFDLPIVLEQLRYTGMLETIRIRKLGYPIRIKYQPFAERYRCLLSGPVPRGAPYKEVCRMILESIPDSREDYQLGSTKVFVKELMEKRLETERVGVLQGSVVAVQRWVRGYLSRKRYLTMRRNAIKVQAWYRGARERRRYGKLRKGVLRAQATYRMLLQKREYEKIKAILARKKEADRLALERAKQRVIREEQERTSRAVAGVNHLEIPAELAFIFSKLEDWFCINSDRNITKAVNVSAKPPHYQLPYDIDQYAFTKFTNVYFKAHVWAMKREPIKTPFLAKTNEVDYQESLAIFKLILRFMNDNNLSGKKERALADYIVQKGLMNEAMRDEIICQLCNQTWKNEKDANKERGWLLMANCLSCFPPGKALYKYLLKYVSDHAHDGYKGFCQKKLLQSEKVKPQNARTYPPSLLEWKANAKRVNMAMEAKFADGGSSCAPVESWSTGESFVSSLLSARGLDESFGWTVDLCDDGDVYELNGNDYVLDLVSELEVPPAFPVCKSFFLVSADKSKAEAGIKHRRSGWGSSPHNPDRINTFEVEIEELPLAPVRHRSPSPVAISPYQERPPPTPLHQEKSNHVERICDQPLPPPPVSRQRELDKRENHVKQQNEERTVVEQHGSAEEESTLRNGRHQRLKSRSLDQLLDSNMDNVLSKKSALNGRYFDGSNNNIYNGSQSEEIDKVEDGAPALSETSKLNKRYLMKKGAAPHSLDIQRPTGPPPPVPTSLPTSPTTPQDWQQGLGLSQSALNDRYFNIKKDASSLMMMKGIPRIGRTSAASLQDLQNVNGHHKHLNGRATSPVGLLPAVIQPRDEVDGRVRSRPSSRNSEDLGVDFPEFDVSEIRLTQEEQEELDDQNGTDKYSHRTSESTRYVKYTAPTKVAPPARIYGHSTKAHIDKSRDPSEFLAPRSSAMSDTSEAPSLASHVKNVRIPSHTSELDQYLDDLFNPVLDGNLDELSDARSLAASIKGGHRLSPPVSPPGNIYMENVFDDLFGHEFSNLQNADELVGKLKGGDSGNSSSTTAQRENLDSFMEKLLPQTSIDPVCGLACAEHLVTSLKGGGVEMQSKPIQPGFNLPLSPMSPPMVNVSLASAMPPSVGTNLSMFSFGGSPQPTFPNSPMQYPYLPVYNVAGMSVPMVDTSQIIQQQFLQQQMVQMQQRAFLASAVQQNLQIQQQLLHQNQALQQLLQTAVVPPTSPPANSQNLLTTTSPEQQPSSLGITMPPNLLTPMTPGPLFPGPMVPTFPPSAVLPLQAEGSKIALPSMIPKTSFKLGTDVTNTTKEAYGDILSELRTKVDAEEPPAIPRSQAPRMPGIPPPPPPPPPPLPPSDDKFPDVYGRAKTVRIGKWRWPPPREDGTMPNSYIEFKMKRQMEREDSRDMEDFVEFEEIPDSAMMGVEDGPEPGPVKRSSSEPVLQEVPPTKPIAMISQKSQESLISEPPTRRLGKPAGSIGKLRISSEMKAKLEQLTLDHSVRSSHKDPRARAPFPKKTEAERSGTAVRKLAENRKSIIEQKLFSSSIDQTDVAPRTRTERHMEESFPESEMPLIEKSPTDFTVENLVKSQVERMERASRVMRERKEELGHPMALQQPSRTSTQHAEYGGPSSQSSSRLEKTLYDQSSHNSRSAIYEESLASSRSMYSQQNQVLPQSMYSTQSAQVSSRPVPFSPKKFAQLSLHPPSVAASSGYYAPSTPVVARRREPPPPIAPSKLFHDHKAAADRIEFEESSEFLKPVDTVPPPGLDIVNQRLAVENIKTKLFGPSNAPYFTYTKTSWELRVRKEVFSPNEKLDNPLTLHLVFCQVVQDIVAPSCIRLNREEKRKITQLLEGYGISVHNMNSSHHKLAIKRSVVDMTKECPNYFSRLFPVSGGRNLPNVQLLGVSHSGVRLVRRERDAISDYLRVLDMLSFDDIAEVSAPQASTLQILLRNGGWMTLYSHKSSQIKNLIERFIVEAAQGSEEFVRAVADYVTKESTLLSFRKGDVIQLVKNKNMHLDKGWLFGVLESGENGIFPCEYVLPLGRQEMVRMANKTSEKVLEGQPQSMPIVARETKANPADDTSPLWVESKAEVTDDVRSEISHMTTPANDGKYSLLQYALFNFRESVDKYDMLKSQEGSIRGSIKMIESIKSSKNKKGRKSKDSDWTWKELADLVKYTKSPIQASLLKFDSLELNKLSIECFIAIMRYMGDYPMAKNQTEVDCVYTILVNCHKYPQLRDEVYCQIMKQTTNNKSSKADSCQRGWRLFSIIGAYFECTEALKMYLIKFLETAAYDKRRAYHGTAMVCLQNLRKTLKYGGRKNVPSIEEIAAISAGRNSKRQIYRLPGGTERVINTKSTTVVEDILQEICSVLNIHTPMEMEEFSLYCIVEGDPYSMPLNREEYILDVTTELLKNGQVFYLIFCRSVWFHPLKLDNQLYIEVIFNQVAPDYLEGLLLVLPGEQLAEANVSDIARIAALLHRAADMDHMPAKEEVKYLLPKPVLGLRGIRPAQWVEMVQRNWTDMTALTTTEAKAQCLDILQKWPLFGSCFFAVKWIRGNNNNQQAENILALNREGVHFLDIVSHETVWKYPFIEVISTRKVRAEDGTLFLDMKCGNLMVQKITRIQTDQAHEVSRLIRQYINIEQRQRGRSRGDNPRDVTLSRQ